MEDLITLIAQELQKDPIGQLVVKGETSREVWATIHSVGRSEWAQAGQIGRNPKLMLTMPLLNYEGEKIAEVKGKRYSIYRTYFLANSDEIELYLEEKVGVCYEQNRKN